METDGTLEEISTFHEDNYKLFDFPEFTDFINELNNIDIEDPIIVEEAILENKEQAAINELVIELKTSRKYVKIEEVRSSNNIEQTETILNNPEAVKIIVKDVRL